MDEQPNWILLLFLVVLVVVFTPVACQGSFAQGSGVVLSTTTPSPSSTPSPTATP